jgi:hypothetical protein
VVPGHYYRSGGASRDSIMNAATADALTPFLAAAAPSGDGAAADA